MPKRPASSCNEVPDGYQNGFDCDSLRKSTEATAGVVQW